MGRILFMGKLNPEKFSQILQEINRYLDFTSWKKYRKKTNLNGEGIW
jgi:hypothetical protein